MFVNAEGTTPLDQNEIEGLKFKHITTRGELDELEQANITQGLRWLGRRRNSDVLTDGFVRALHKRLFGDVWTWAGTYRIREKSIGIDPLQISVQFHQLLGNAQHWAEQATYDPLEAAARFHHRMVQIHHSLTATGDMRVSRLMCIWKNTSNMPRSSGRAASIFRPTMIGARPISLLCVPQTQAISSHCSPLLAHKRTEDKEMGRCRSGGGSIPARPGRLPGDPAGAVRPARLAPLVFVRPGEPRRAECADIDLEGAEWRYTVTKTNTPHVRASCVAARARTPCGCRPVRSNP